MMVKVKVNENWIEDQGMLLQKEVEYEESLKNLFKDLQCDDDFAFEFVVSDFLSEGFKIEWSKDSIYCFELDDYEFKWKYIVYVRQFDLVLFFSKSPHFRLIMDEIRDWRKDNEDVEHNYDDVFYVT